MRYTVEKSTLGGSVTVTTSKSHTMRAILLASLAEGESRVRRALPSPDTEAMVAACTSLGANIARNGDDYTIHGTGGRLCTPDNVIDVGNSGQVLRFAGALAALLPQHTVLTGDHSVRHIRPMRPLLDALGQLGALAVSSKGDGKAPVIIRGPVRPGRVRMDGKDSQPVSAMLFLAAHLPGVTAIEVENPGEQPWIDLTLYWLDRLGVPYTARDYTSYTVQGRGRYPAFDYTVPGDWSSAAFPIAAALVTNSALTLENMDIADPQGDKAVLGMFERMGARIEVDEKAKTVTVHPHQGLKGIEADMNAAVDALPVLAAVACFASSPTRLTGAGICRHKECDRIAAMAEELGKMGARLEELEDGLIIHPSVLLGARADSRRDHRIAMSLAVAGLACGGMVINDVACVAKSFPGFAAAMRGVGAAIEEA